jgi:6-phosphogluconate dehydrogenase
MGLRSWKRCATQDVDESEGPGTCTCEEAIRLHGCTCSHDLSAHAFRCAAADLSRRIKNSEVAGADAVLPRKMAVSSNEDFIEEL